MSSSLDHLIYNSDRNSGNIILQFLKQEVFLYIIDHTHVFNKQCLWDRFQLKRCQEEDDYLDKVILEKNNILYSMFFQTIPMSIEDFLLISKEYKSKINRERLEEILSKVPAEWQLFDEDAKALLDYLMYRLEKLDEICKVIIEK